MRAAASSVAVPLRRSQSGVGSSGNGGVNHFGRVTTKCLPFACCTILITILLFYEYLGNSGFREARLRTFKSQSISDQWIYGGNINDNILHERGLLMCANGDDNSMMSGVEYTISLLREKYKSMLPIAIAHCSELSRATKNELRSSFPNVMTRNICKNVPRKQIKRLRTWFCKTMALTKSPFNQTLLVDTDLIWFNNPERLFESPAYKRSGALFFRDRILYESTNENDGLHYNEVLEYINSHRASISFVDPPSLESVASTSSSSSSSSSATITAATETTATSTQPTSIPSQPLLPADIMQLSKSNGVNVFWRHGVSSENPPLRHVQESSVVLMDRRKCERTYSVIETILPTFNLGYGDKEIYWIAATIAQDNFEFEPYLGGIYGDCGEIFHFDPSIENDASRNDEGSATKPLFLNGQYIAGAKKSLETMEKRLQQTITKPVRVTTDLKIVEMGSKDKKTAGRCGACQAMGCEPVSPEINEEIKRFQRVVHTRFMQTSDLYKVYMELRRRIKKSMDNLSDKLGWI